MTSNGTSATQTFDEAGALLTRTFSNGVVESRDYDEAGRLTEITVEKGPEVLEEFTYALDPVGNPTQVTGPRGPENYEYDELDRLTEVCFTACALDFIRWTYDPVGNRLSEERLPGTITYDYDDSDRLTQEHSPLGVTTAYSYDENGNQTARGSERFAYDAANHHAAHIVGPVVHRYRYDGEDKRVSAETKPAGAGAGARTDYVWDLNNAYPLLIEEAEHANAATANSRTYVHGDTELLFSTDDPLVGDTVTRFSAHDRIGSVVALTDTDGERDSTYAYEPFGTARPTTVESPTAPSNPMRFAGEDQDSRSGLYHLRARDYDPARGRFLARDPADAAFGSTYAYADNRPTILTDPRGLRASRRQMMGPLPIVGQIPIAPPIPIAIPLPPWLDPWRTPFKAPRGTPREDGDFRGDSGCSAKSDNPHASEHRKGRVVAAGRTICPAAEMPYLRVSTESWLFERELFGGGFEQVDHPGARRVKQDGAFVHVGAVVSTDCPQIWSDFVIETRHTVTRGGQTSTTWTKNSRNRLSCLREG